MQLVPEPQSRVLPHRSTQWPSAQVPLRQSLVDDAGRAGRRGGVLRGAAREQAAVVVDAGAVDLARQAGRAVDLAPAARRPDCARRRGGRCPRRRTRSRRRSRALARSGARRCAATHCKIARSRCDDRTIRRSRRRRPGHPVRVTTSKSSVERAATSMTHQIVRDPCRRRVYNGATPGDHMQVTFARALTWRPSSGSWSRAGTALAGPALDDGKAAASAPATGPGARGRDPGAGRQGRRVRRRASGCGNVRVPQGAARAVRRARSPAARSNFGFGVDLTRRRGNVELQLGFEYEHIKSAEGVWINKGDERRRAATRRTTSSAPITTDGKSLGWFTIEFTFLNHAEINKYVRGALRRRRRPRHHDRRARPLRRDLQRRDERQPGAGLRPPRRSAGPRMYGEGADPGRKYDLPPVFPVVNAILGLQIRPTAEDRRSTSRAGSARCRSSGSSAGYFFYVAVLALAGATSPTRSVSFSASKYSASGMVNLRLAPVRSFHCCASIVSCSSRNASSRARSVGDDRRRA